MQRWLNSLPKISKAECRKAIRQLEESGWTHRNLKDDES